VKARDALLIPVQKSLDIVLKKCTNDHHSETSVVYFDLSKAQRAIILETTWLGYASQQVVTLSPDSGV
jgi:hypothetical protein